MKYLKNQNTDNAGKNTRKNKIIQDLRNNEPRNSVMVGRQLTINKPNSFKIYQIIDLSGYLI